MSRRVRRGLLASPLVLAAVVVLLRPSDASAQGIAEKAPPATTGPVVRVVVDLAAGAFDRSLPFDVPFFITGRAPEGAQSLDVQYALVPKSGDASAPQWLPGEPLRWRPDRPAGRDEAFLVLVRPPLEAGKAYRMRFTFRSERAPAENVSFAEGRTEQKNYVSLDAGVLYAGDISTGALYVGTNLYFRPVNKDAPLTAAGSLGRRLAATVGLTISSIADENDRTRSDLFWHQSLVIGGGYRITSSIRGGGGMLVFRQSDPNPLVTSKSTAITWYASFSLDLDVLKGFAR